MYLGSTYKLDEIETEFNLDNYFPNKSTWTLGISQAKKLCVVLCIIKDEGLQHKKSMNSFCEDSNSIVWHGAAFSHSAQTTYISLLEGEFKIIVFVRSEKSLSFLFLGEARLAK